MAFVMETVEDLWNHIAYTLAYAPLGFPKRDFLEPQDQMTLDKAFEQLREGVLVVYPEDEFVSKRDHLNSILAESYRLYQFGDPVEAGHKLNEFEDNIFKAP